MSIFKLQSKSWKARLADGIAVSLFATMSWSVCADSNIDISGLISQEHRQFFVTGNEGQSQNQQSVVLQPELSIDFEDWGTFDFVPFYRYDARDDERSHFDIREALYMNYWGDYELRVGIGKVFWGVTESVHLVDIVNQSDSVESLEGEDKLGQPMIHTTVVKDWGTIDLLALPYFRERTFAGRDGRLRGSVINTDNALYEHQDKENHLDFASRYSTVLGDFDLGLSYFNGTSRDPEVRISGGQFVPFYGQLEQIGVDVQGIMGDWLWKLESIYRDDSDYYNTSAAGFEYTYIGILDSNLDLGLIAEYQYDSRDENATVPGQNDLFWGTRWVFNDEDGTEILFGMTDDLDHSDIYSGKIEASSRLSNHWKWRVEGYFFKNDTPSDLFYSARNDDFIELALEYYF